MRIRSTPAWLAVALVLAGCAKAPAADDVKVELKFEPDPPRVGLATVAVVLTDAAKAPVLARKVRLEGNMNHAGMVPVIADAKEVEPGCYETGFEFTMGGDWYVVVDAELADGRKLERTVFVPAVAGN